MPLQNFPLNKWRVSLIGLIELIAEIPGITGGDAGDLVSAAAGRGVPPDAGVLPGQRPPGRSRAVLVGAGLAGGFEQLDQHELCDLLVRTAASATSPLSMEDTRINALLVSLRNMPFRIMLSC